MAKRRRPKSEKQEGCIVALLKAPFRFVGMFLGALFSGLRKGSGKRKGGGKRKYKGGLGSNPYRAPRSRRRKR